MEPEHDANVPDYLKEGARKYLEQEDLYFRYKEAVRNEKIAKKKRETGWLAWFFCPEPGSPPPECMPVCPCSILFMLVGGLFAIIITVRNQALLGQKQF